MRKTARETRQSRRQSRRFQQWITGGFIGVALLLVSLISYTSKNPNQAANYHPTKAVTNLFSTMTLGDQLHKTWRQQFKATDANVAVAVYSAKTGQTYRATNAPKHQFYTASTVKVAILAGLLQKENGQLSSHEDELATAMIENSNNDATNELFENYIGGKSGLQKIFDHFEMTHSIASNYWGLTVTTPSDQLRLLNNIYFHSDQLSASEQAYIRNLMANVESDQQWGISAGSSSYGLKNGWLSYGKRKWIINSIGYINGPGDNNYTIAVYTDNNSSMATGEQVVEKLAKATRQVMDQANP
ncbi:serine hydrolase [Lactobacillus alvi]|uniref:Serine hydrolase n=1 Tax=Limosilactobacillus alvi TaxID=990412 RepID=A0ABS2EM31_9LACO|nr:serine hydrolase [Limosilactobacillus alvi]MBM6753445.1 serine hydrolase [Limosilactobacillus alvi]